MKTIQTACACCGQDIEGNAREGWRDRGNGRACLPFVARDGVKVRPVGLMHSDRLTVRAMLRRGGLTLIQHPHWPGRCWIYGWQARDPRTGRYGQSMRYRDALQHAREMLQQADPC